MWLYVLKSSNVTNKEPKSNNKFILDFNFFSWRLFRVPFLMLEANWYYPLSYLKKWFAVSYCT